MKKAFVFAALAVLMCAVPAMAQEHAAATASAWPWPAPWCAGQRPF